jgi:hypothetical protein
MSPARKTFFWIFGISLGIVKLATRGYKKAA